MSELQLRGGNNDTHSLLSPSGSKKWLGCSASLLMEKDIPNTSSPAAAIGTACHTLSEVYLNQYIKDGKPLPLKRNVGAYVLDEGRGSIKAAARKPRGGILITEDMVAQVEKYTSWVTSIIDAADFVKLEMKVHLSDILHPGFGKDDEVEVETSGTADLVAIIGTTLIVGDLKTGRHKVDAEENKQLMIYALGVLRRLRRRYTIDNVRLAIFQPLAGGLSEWDITPEGLEIFAKFASKRAIAALDVYFAGKKNVKNTDFKPSAGACQWCRFADKCVAKARSAGVALGKGQEVADDNIEMTPDQLKAEWDKLPELEQHIASIRKAVYARLQAGEKVPGLKLVAGKEGNRAWKDAKAVDKLIEDEDNGYLLHESVVISPTAAEKKIKSEDPDLWEKLEKLIERKPGKPSVADESDDRPAIGGKDVVSELED